MNAPTARRVQIDPTLPQPSWAHEPVVTHEGFSFPTWLGIAEGHLAKAREAVRLSISLSRQREQHAIYLNQDQVDYLKDCEAEARVDARKHIAEAIRAGWKRGARRAA